MPKDLMLICLDEVRKMRAYQVQYFRDKNPYLLKRAKEAEVRVDRLLVELKKGNNETR